MIDKMEKGNSDHKKRAFVVCSHQESRDGVFRQLPSASFEVRSAITLNAMVSEPKYFTQISSLSKALTYLIKMFRFFRICVALYNLKPA